MTTLIRLKRVMLVGLVSVSLTITQLPLQGQTRRAGPPRQTPTTPADTRTPAAKPNVSLILSSLTRGRAMGAALRSGQLPEPLRKPQGTDDEVAATLAKKVSARDEQSTSALLAAILAAGFAVRDPDGALTQTVEPGQGLVFDAWEVAAIAKNYGEAKKTTLTYLADGFKSIPALNPVPLDKILLEGIRKHAQGNQQVLRFWSRFIIELGRQADQPYDMLKENNPASIRLDAIQVALILQRLYGDLYSFAESKRAGSIVPENTHAGNASAVRSQVVGSGVSRQLNHARSPSGTVISNLPFAPQNRPCQNLGQGDGSLILDAAANTITTGWGELLDYLGKETFAKLLAAVNIVLAYAKFILTYAFLETEITVENPPLVRTTDSVPGQRRRLTAKVTMNIGKGENINCFRTALNVALGIDVSLLSDGPLENVGVVWHLIEGGGGDFYSNSGGITGKRQIVGFWNGGPRIQDAGTNAGVPGQGGTPVTNATRTTTDKDGLARVYLEGSPHVPYVPQPHLPVMKRAVVLTTVKLKGGDIKGDAVDLFGQVLGGVAGLVSMPTELLYRTDWASTATLEVPVKDWETCERGWHGTITVTGKLNDTTDQMPDGPQGWSLSHTREVIKDFQYKFILNGVRDTSAGSQNGYVAEVEVRVDSSDIQVTKTRKSGFCDTGRRNARGSKITVKVDGIETHTFDNLLRGSGTTKTTVYIAQRGSAGYNMLIDAPYPVTGKRILRNQTEFPECPLWERVRSSPDDVRDEGIFPPTMEFLVPLDDPKNPQTVSGSRVDRDARSRGNGTITYKWELTLCN